LPNWLGDVLLARPVLNALARAHGATNLRAAAPAPLLELLAADGAFQSSDTWPAHGAERDAARARVRAWGPAAALVLPPSFSSALDALRCGARVRVGFAGEWRSPLLTRALRRPPRGARHLSEEYMDLGAALAGGPLPAEDAGLPPLQVPAPWQERARALLRERRLDGAPLALLGPGAIYGPAKRWEAPRFAELGARLARRGHAVAVCGTAAEGEVCEAVAAAVAAGAGTPLNVASLAGVTTLADQAGLCALAAVAVCNDSGLAHLAAAVGARTVVIFGSTSSAWTAPLGARVRVVQHAPVCSPCFQRRCRIGTPCLEAVTVNEVEAACVA
jgi:heptosyltransferase-2